MKKWYKYPLFLFVSLIFNFTVTYGDGGKCEEFKEIYDGNSGDIIPCELLSKTEVETVLPGSDEGYTASSGSSLMEGVDSYQCSYSNDKMGLLTVIFHVAATEKDFDWIKPKKSYKEDYEDAQELSIGDGGWLYGDQKDMKVKVVKGYSVIELELISDDAKQKGNALVELATAILKKI